MLCLASNVAQANCSDAIDTINSAISNLSNALHGCLTPAAAQTHPEGWQAVSYCR